MFLRKHSAPLAAIVLIPAALSGCGSGAAALFSAADSDDNAEPQPFEVRFDESTPRMFAPEAGGTVVSTIQSLSDDQYATSEPVLQVEFNRRPAEESVQPSDFLLTRISPSNVDLEPVAPSLVRVNTDGVQIVLDTALYLNGLYRVDIVGQVTDEVGMPLTGSRTAVFQVDTGSLTSNLTTGDPIEELVTFGEVAAGGLRLGGGNRTFASAEAFIGNRYFIATNAADISGVYTSPELLYQGSGANFDQLNTSSIQLNGSTALIRTQEGRLNSVHNGNADDSVRIKAFPGSIFSAGSDISWPNLVSANQDPDRYVIDRGPLFDSGGASNDKHIAWRPRIHPLNPQQAQNGLGKNVLVWWGWTDEIPAGSTVPAMFDTYGVYANHMDIDLGFNNEWSDPVLLSDPADDSVGWPMSTAFPDGSVAAIWHDAPTKEELYTADVFRYQGARFNAQTNSWGPSSTLNLGVNLGRIGSVESVGPDEFLVFARLDQDGDASIDASVPEEASITVRRLGFDAAGNLATAAGFPDAIAAPQPANGYNVEVGLENVILPGNTLPLEGDYSDVRNASSAQIPSADPIDGSNYVVTWRDESPSGDPRLWISVFDAANMEWRNGEALDVIGQLGLTNISGEFEVVGVTVDRLGFASVAWREGDRFQPTAVRMVRTTGSILGSGATPLADVFPASMSAAEDVVTFVSNDPANPGNQAAGGIYPSFPGVSNVDGSGHFAFFWARRFYEAGSSGGNGVVIGTNARRFR